MTRLRRSTGTALALSALAATALAGASAPAALAADDCPNAAVRAQQQSQHLPNCMAYERISPEDKNGGGPVAQLHFSVNGDRVLYGTPAELDGSLSNVYGQFRSTRGADGWLTESLNPDFWGPPPVLQDQMRMDGASDDLDRVVMSTSYGLDPNDQGRFSQAAGAPGSADLYRRESDGSFTWITANPSEPDTSSQTVRFLDASTDLERVVIETTRQFDSRVPADSDVSYRYVWSQSGTQLATVLPDGELPGAVENSVNSIVDRVSDDGRRVAFTDPSSATATVYVRVNADDPQTAATRELGVGQDGTRCADAELLGLSPDGTTVIFSCASALVPGAPTRAVYLQDVDGGPETLRVVGPAYQAAAVYGSNDDYSRIYMDGLGDDVALHLVRDGVPEQIAPLGTSPVDANSDRPRVASASPNGEYFAFQTGRDHELPGVDVGPPGTEQVYRYAAGTGEVRCISCRQDGSPTSGSGVLRGEVPYVAVDDPSTPVADNGAVSFSSASGLVAADTNGLLDAYAWIDGKPVLLSGGRNAEPSIAMGTVLDGTGFVVTTGDALVPDDRDGGGYDMYMARAGGGFLVPDVPTECTTSCKSNGPERPSLPTVASVDALGRGNLVEQTTSPGGPAPRATASLTVSKAVRGTSTSVRVKVSRAGSIRVSGVGLRQATVKAKKAGTYRVTVRLSAFGAKQQKRRGRLATRLTARFTPQSGASVQVRKSVTFTATKKGGR